MTTILQNAVFSKKVTATASDEKYNYNVDYEVADNGKTLVSVTLNATKIAGNTYAGNACYQNKNKTTSIPETEDDAAIVAMFNSVIEEIKSTLVTE